ncbi:hypothetical protein BS50DRAFT_373469 [Corynespora cassiicola Philippines]|uniref:Zn(2)-C6 fungal-type domain-containing protein n=1 Tax=Corynespora cassiicola Philippines TaxID=1448308 RepID=A0A2T2NMZ1_CORCC|nr:hypothetical protein BS50DRAFT_373469 [Corynespora cassiicola Philippines]
MPSQGQSKRRAGTNGNQDEDRPSGKRSRVSRACDQCRTAREKCDGVQPTCFTCSSSKRSCTYTSPAKKRGIQPGYIRTLELALTWLFQQNPEIEASLNRKLSREGPSSMLLSRDSKESNKLHRAWRKTKFCKDVDRVLSGGQIGDGADDSRSPDSEDDSDGEELPTALSIHDAQSEIQLQQEVPFDIDAHQRDISSLPSRAIRTSQDFSETSRPLDPLTRAPFQQEPTPPRCLPPNSWRLFDIYFAYTQSWLPICEKNDVLKLSYSYPESGLVLSASTPDSGSHAELWSIFALASVQESTLEANPDRLSTDPEQMYDVARALIPSELGSFTIGHVRALLNLAAVNLGQSAPEASWLLIGLASRIFSAIEQSHQPADPRRKHVLSACFVLDSLVSMQLGRRPHFQRSDIARAGKIEPDGLEEWQPWHWCFGAQLSHQARTPALALSIFNTLVEIVDFLGQSVLPGSTFHSQDMQNSMEVWRTSLPQQFDFIRNERSTTPPTPQAYLLQLVHCCAAMTVSASRLWAQRTLKVFEQLHSQMGIASMPPVLHSIFDIMRKSKAFSALDQRFQMRFHSIQADFHRAWMFSSNKSPMDAPGPSSVHSRPSLGAAQMPTPESMQIPLNSPFMAINNQSVNNGRPRTGSTLLEDLLPDMNASTANNQNPMNIQNFNFTPFDGGLNPPSLDHSNSAASRDIESFFDELASLDGAEKSANRPQFMQNLGFAPDANMADFLAAEFSQLIPMNSSTFIPQNSSDAQIDHSSLYDAG